MVYSFVEKSPTLKADKDFWAVYGFFFFATSRREGRTKKNAYTEKVLAPTL
jgi:hypothetical protein